MSVSALATRPAICAVGSAAVPRSFKRAATNRVSATTRNRASLSVSADGERLNVRWYFPPHPHTVCPYKTDTSVLQSTEQVVVVGAECAPFSKTGGLGDVMSSLPKVRFRV